MIKRNPETVSEGKILELYKKAASDKKSDKMEARRAAQQLRLALSNDKSGYWTIIRKYTNLRQPDIDFVIQKAISLTPQRNPKSSKITKTKSKTKAKRNPITTLNRTGEVVLKYKGSKVIFDGKDANDILDVIRNEYSDNSDLQTVLG